MQADDQVLLAIIRPADVDIAGGKSGIAEALGHGFGCSGYAAHGICGVDFYELLKDVVRKVLRRVVELSLGDWNE